jgi:hypothetical protein
MTVEKKVKVTAATSYPLGNAKEAKDASSYTKFKYPTGGGKDIGVYKQPMPNAHAASSEVVSKSGNGMDKNNISVAGVSKGNYAPDNQHGEKTMRGYGAATKGIKTRGPMA